jgi:hypothetical protein
LIEAGGGIDPSDYTIDIDGFGLTLGDLTAGNIINLDSNGVLTYGDVRLANALQITVIGLDALEFNPEKIKSLPTSTGPAKWPSYIAVSSTSGSLCVGALSAQGVCTPKDLVTQSKNSQVWLHGYSGLKVGDVSAGSASDGWAELSLRATLGDVTSGDLSGSIVDVQAGTNGVGIRNSGRVYYSGPYRINAGDITSSTGSILLQGSNGISVGNISQSGVGSPSGVPNVDLQSKDGAITALDLVSSGWVRVNTLEGSAVSLKSLSGSTLQLDAVAGRIDVGTLSGANFTGGLVTSTDGSITINTRDGFRAGNMSATNGFVRVQASSAGVTVGTVFATAADQENGDCKDNAVCITAGSTATSGDQQINAGQVSATSGSIKLEGRTGVVTTGKVESNTGSVRLNATAGQITTTNQTVTAGTSVDIQAGVKKTIGQGEDPYTTGTGTFNVVVGTVTANNGTVLVSGRDGILAKDVTQARLSSSAPQVPEVELQTGTTGSITADDINSKGFNDAGGRLRVVGPNGVSLASARGSDVELSAQAGPVRIGTTSGNGNQFNGGDVTATTGDALVTGRSVEVGDVDGRDITLTSTAANGALTFGDLSPSRNLALSSAADLTVESRGRRRPSRSPRPAASFVLERIRVRATTATARSWRNPRRRLR